MTTKVHLRSVFISDLHMGYKGADIRAVNAFLSTHDFRHLYLVGDILDGWKLEQRWYWSQDYSDFFDHLIDLRNRGVRITLLTGNHDEKLRLPLARLFRPILFRRFGIQMEEQVTHETKGGQRLLVMHGDQFDGPLFQSTSRHADRVWARIDDLTWIKPWAVRAQGDSKRARWSLGKAIATNAKALIGSFADTALRRVGKENMDGIICGHSHVPAVTQRGKRLFANCGSWTGARGAGGYHTAVVERCDGTLELVKWPVMRLPEDDPRCKSLRPSHPNTRTPDAAKLARLVYRLWTPARLDGATSADMFWPSRSQQASARQ